MPEIDIRAGQQPSDAKRIGPDQLAKTEYRLQQFFRQQAEDVYVQMGRNERERQGKIKQANEQEYAARRRMWQQAQQENQAFDSRARKTERDRAEKLQRDYVAANSWNKKLDNDKREAERRAFQDRDRQYKEASHINAAFDRRKQQDEAAMWRDALREDRDFESEKTRKAKETYAEAFAENKTIDANKRRVERDRVKADERAQRAAANEAEYKRTHSFMYGATLGAGVAAIGSQIVGGGAPSRILGTAAGALGGGIASAAGASPKSAGIIAEMAELATEIVLKPNQIANRIISEIQDYTVEAMSLSRAALQPGMGAYNEFYRGENMYDPRMARVGLGPRQAIQSLQSLGVVPTDQSSYVDLATTMRAFSISSAFTGMKAGTVEGLVGQAMGQGNLSSTGAGTGYYLNTFAKYMEEATARGMDRSKLLESMQSSMDIVAKSNAMGISTEAIQDLTFRMMQSGIQGGRTGQAAMDITAGITGTMSNIMGNKLSSTMLMTQLPQFGNLKTAADVQAFVGKKAWAASGSTTEGQAHRDFVTQMATQAAAMGNMPLAMQYAMEIAKSDPGRLPALLGGPLGMAAGGNAALLAPLLMQAENISFSEATAQIAQAGLGPTSPGISGRQVMGLTSGRGMGVAGSMMTYDSNVSDSVYLAKLQSMGISPEAAKAILEGAKASNTNPYMLAAIGKQESGNNPNQGWNNPDPSLGKNQKVSYGPMQINRMNWRDYPGGSQTGAANYEAGGALFQDLLRQSHGNIEEALARYRGKFGDPIGAAYAQSVEQTFGQLQGTVSPGTSGGFPGSVYESQYKADYQGLQTASIFSGLADSANALTDALKAVTIAATNAATALGGGSSRPAGPARHSQAMP